MKKFKKSLLVLVPSLFWFLILPFPFERSQPFPYAFDRLQIITLTNHTIYTVWAWLGGYHLFITEFQGIIPIGSVAQEENDSLYHYASHWYLLAFVLCSLALGVLTHRVIEIFRKSGKSK